MSAESRPGFIVALPQEAGSLTSSRLRVGESTEEDGMLIAVSGMGGQNAGRMAEKLSSEGATALISWGCAAGITETARPGDLFLPEMILDEELRSVVHTDRRLRGHLLEQLNACTNNRVMTTALVSSSQIIASSAEKKGIFGATRAAAIDMESFTIGQIAEKHSLPFLAIRAIADPLELTLPAIITDGRCMTQDGMIRPIPFAARLLSQPGTLIELIRIASCFARAKKSLRLAAGVCRGSLANH